MASSLFHRAAERRLPAVQLHDATRRLRASEQVVEDLLVTAFPGWRPMHPRARGWRYSSPDAIDVYRAVDSLEAAEELFGAGFGRVTAHAHDNLAPCRCRSRFCGASGATRSGEIPARAPSAVIARGHTPAPALPRGGGTRGEAARRTALQPGRSAPISQESKIESDDGSSPVDPPTIVAPGLGSRR